MSGVVALDDRIFEVSWQRIFVEAGTPAKNHLAPLPRHLLADLYEQDKKAFLGSPFWTTEQYIGAGPFAVASRDPGVRITLRANPYFVFGRPNIDAVEMDIVPDKNSIVVRLLAGEADFADWGDISVPDAALLGEQWKATGAGQLYTAMVVNRGLVFQYRDVPGHQKALLDLRVRQAFMHAIDREALGRAETSGLGGASDTPFPPDHVLWPRIDRVITKYPLDVRRTEALLNEAGWTKPADGLFRNAGGDALDVEITASSDYPRSPVIISDYLKQAGINARPVITPEGLDADAEYRASYPGATVESWTPGLYDRIWVGQLSTPENGFRGRNRGSYSNPQLDALVERLNTTLDTPSRDDIFVEMERLVSADVAVGHLYYQVRPGVALSSLKGITGYPYTWNVWQWRLV
jgi:peptide/nickel transport system substrate-binding protein